MSTLGSLPEPWVSNGPVTLAVKLPFDPAETATARSSFPDLMSFLPEKVSFRSWSTSVLELASSSPPPQPATRPAAASTAMRMTRSERERMSVGLQHGSRRNFEPSIGVMGLMRIACCVIVGILCSLVPAGAASADDVLVLGRDGQLRRHDDKALPATVMQVPPHRARA